MFTVEENLKRSVEKIGLRRVVFDKKNIPSSMENITVLVFFGDVRSSFILSSLILKRIKEEINSSKYFILISWPGNEFLYPYVDEYWTIEKESVLQKIKFKADGFENNSEYKMLLIRELNEWFYEVLSESDMAHYYKNGLTKNFFKIFTQPKVFFPAINSIAYLGSDVARKLNENKNKIFIYPNKKISILKQGKIQNFDLKKEFWVHLVSKLIESDFFPVIYEDIFTHELKYDFQENIYIKNDISAALTAMRSCGLVLDVFSGIYKMAICARSPFLCFEERSKYNFLKDYEVDDLCAYNLMPKEYIFAFSTILTKGEERDWSSIYETIISMSKNMTAVMDRDRLPPTTEQYKVVPYSIVRENKIKKLGTKFIKVKEDR